MAKLRVHQLARELNRDNSEVIRELQLLGAPVTSHSNTVEDRMAEQLRQTLGPLVIEKPKPKRKAAKKTKVSKKKEETPITDKPEVVTDKPKVVKAKPKPVKIPVPEETPTARVIKPTPEPTLKETQKLPSIPPDGAETPQPQPQPPPTPVAPVSTAGAEVQQAEKKTTVHRRVPPQKKTMQQLAQERLREQNRPVPTPGRRPVRTEKPSFSRPVRPPQSTPSGTRPGTRPWGRGPTTPRRDRPKQTRASRVQRQINLSTMPRPPKVEEPREFMKVTLTENLTIKELAEKLDARTKDVIKKLMDRGVFATINQTLDKELAEEICKDFNAESEFVTFEESVLLEAVEIAEPEKMVERSPVVTIMGHVDHGKTSLLDSIRETSVTEQEHGGITQHIGAYQVHTGNRKITFLDTPGHEAFTLMRARGASVTDIVILVVAADDGVMPQTIESISHTRAAKVPFIVAINKIDVPNADVDRVKRELAEHDLLAEDWGGDIVTVEVSAKQKTNLDGLLEMILLLSDMRQLKADPDFPAMGTVLEAKLDKGRGAVATVLIQNGTLRIGDNFIVGSVYGKVRAMYDDQGKQVKEAGPSVPVEVQGLQGLPQAGDPFQMIADDNKARQMAKFRQEQAREIEMAKSSRLTLEQLHLQLEKGNIKEVPIVIKSDVQGSAEVLTEMLNKVSTEKVKVRIIHSMVGGITEYDVLLAATSNAIIIGFNVRPERKATALADREKVDIRLHTVIYNVVDEIKRAMVGVLDPITKETYLGSAEVRDTFKVPSVGMIAGSYITEGHVLRNADVRLLRNNVVIYEGKISSLKRFKEDTTEVKTGYECGIGLQNYNDVKVGDLIEAFVTEKVTADIGV